MAKSVKQIGDEIAANERLIQELSALEEIGTKNLPVTERLIVNVAIDFILAVQENLRRLDKVDTGGLEKGIGKGELLNNAGTYSIEIGYPADSKQAGYYDYVNKGVKGFVSQTPNSPYRFRNATPSLNGPMTKALQQWMKRQGIVSRTESRGSIISSLQRKRKSISELDSSKVAAWNMAKRIKSRGLPKTGFFDNAVDLYFGDSFAEAIAKSIGADIRVGVKQVNSLINDKNK
jgi:hypothetical protein